MQEGRGTRLPYWFRVGLATTRASAGVRAAIERNRLNTVCKSAGCPNRTECWNAGTATFLILGNRCSRSCTFCAVSKGIPAGSDPDEPRRVARAVFELGLRYVVITSVTRDDLFDGGASVFAATIAAVRSAVPGCGIEVLIPDFQGSAPALKAVLAASPDILNHNVETVPSLYAKVRPRADYRRSLKLLARAVKAGFIGKTGLMLGLGEGIDEVTAVMEDIRGAGVSRLTLGQYLRPGKDNLPVAKFYHPEEFDMLRGKALALGFSHVVAGPRVRSSYRAGADLPYEA